MLKRNIYILVIGLAALLLNACTKVQFEKSEEEVGGISFYNASNRLDALLGTSKTGQKIIIRLMPENAQALQPAGSNLQPVFVGGSSISYVRDFPAVSILDQFPWTVFANYTTGGYQVKTSFNSLDSASLFNYSIKVDKGTNITYCLSDSAGIFKVTNVPYQNSAGTGKARFRFIQLSPDCDSANVRINTVFQAGKFQNMPYRYVSPYVEYAMPKDSLLRIRVFRGKDTLNTIGRVDLPAEPGLSYSLIYRGYSKDHPAKTFGNNAAVFQNGFLEVRKNQ